MSSLTTSPSAAPGHGAEIPRVNSANGASEDASKSFKIGLSEGLFIALATAYSYLLTFQYEKGYISYFGIPEHFIDVSLGNVLMLAGVAVGFVVLYSLTISGLVTFIPAGVGNHPVFKRHVISLGIYSLFVYIPAYIYETRAMWIFAIGSTVLGIFTYFVLPLILFRKETGYIKQLEAAQVRLDRPDNLTSVIAWSAPKFNPKLIILGFILAYFVFIAEQAGRMKATNQKEFLTMSAMSKEMAFLRAYSDKLIFAPFDGDTMRIEKRFVILSISDLKTPLSLRAIGPLIPVSDTVHHESPEPSPVPPDTKN